MRALQDAILDRLETGETFTIKAGRLGSGEQGVALRSIPSPPGDRYADGRTSRFAFQIYTKDADHARAIDTIERLTKKLEALGPGAITGAGFALVSLDVTTEPAYVEENTAGQLIYTALFSAEYEKTGGN